MEPFAPDGDDTPEEIQILETAGRELWSSRRRWIHSLAALRAEPVVTATVAELRRRDPAQIDVIRWIRWIYKRAPVGPDCPAIAIALDLLPPVASDQSMRSVMVPLLGLKGARFSMEGYRAGDLKPGEDDGPTAPVILDDVIVPAVALRVIEALQGLEPPALADVLRWLNGFWVRDERVLSDLSRLVEALVLAGDTPGWRPGTAITPAWALEALAEKSPAASSYLRRLAELVRHGEHEPNSSSNDGAAGVETYLRRLAISGSQVAELTQTQSKARDEIVLAVMADPPRSVLIVGEPGSGRSVIAAAAACTTSELGSPAYIGSPADVSAGAVYTNELDGRIKRVLEGIARGDAVWVAPDFDRAATIGRHADSSSNFADRITPAVAAGRIRLIAEVSDSGYARLLRESPQFADACETVRLEAPPPDELRAITSAALDAAASRQGLTVPVMDDATFALAGDICRAFLPHLAQPEALVRLGKRLVAECAAEGSSRVAAKHLYAAVTALTGLPRHLVDPMLPLDLGSLKARLSAQVMGQPEAVNALVERVAMIKAGLCSRERPNGVFLFVGPPGTGKTELARTLARELFGNADRLIRVDMSELDRYAATLRLLGGDRDRGSSLADEVGSQPFSVVLLDEFEKSDPRTWDIFLPVFDAGFLTDALGRRVDFRQTIIVATSNLGAELALRGSVGFASGKREDFDDRPLIDAVRKAFRPELINRFDRIVPFRPLSREVAQGIVRCEINSLFRRRGLSHYDWAFELDESAVDLILEHGFSKDLGARPVRRAVEQLVAAPLAMKLATTGPPDAGQSVLLKAHGDELRIHFLWREDGPHRPLSGETSSHDLARHHPSEAEEAACGGDHFVDRERFRGDVSAPTSGGRRESKTK